MGNRNGNANGPLSAVTGVILVLIGIVFLVQQFAPGAFPIFSWRLLWPFFIIIPGLVFFAGMIQGGKSAGGFAIPGSIITTVGVLLFYQNLTGHWQSWAYAWALVAPTGVGVGLLIQGWWSGSATAEREGRRLVAIGITLFVVGAVFFEFVVNISGFATGEIGRLVLPVLLIVAGGFFVLRGSSRRRAPWDR